MDKRETARLAVAEALGVPEVDGSAGFFDLGGDSMTALRAITLLEKQFGHELDIVDLLTAETLDDYFDELLLEAGAGHPAAGQRGETGHE